MVLIDGMEQVLFINHGLVSLVKGNLFVGFVLFVCLFPRKQTSAFRVLVFGPSAQPNVIRVGDLH